MIPTRDIDFYGDQTRWFLGRVRSVSDPLKLGRLQVRIYGVHSDNTQDISDDDLPWAQVVVPITEGGISGLGNNVGIQVGARVFGMFLDGQNSQDPLVLGSLPKIETESDGAIEVVTTPELAQGTKAIEKTANAAVDEPNNPYGAVYPKNAVHKTYGGHVIEIDDTDGAERIHIFHKSGSFMEMHPNGDVVTWHKNGFKTVTGNDKLHVQGDMSILVEGRLDISAMEDINISSMEDINIHANTNMKLDGGTRLDLNLGQTDDGTGMLFGGEVIQTNEGPGGSGPTTDEEGNNLRGDGYGGSPDVYKTGNKAIGSNTSIEDLLKDPGKCTRENLGDLSGKYESWGDPSVPGQEKHGDGSITYSWGTHQIASYKGKDGDETSTMERFLSHLASYKDDDSEGVSGREERIRAFASDLNNAGGQAGAVAKTTSFKNKWAELANNDEFNEAQKEFVKRTHYNALVNEIKADPDTAGIDFCDGTWSNGVQEAVFSASVNHGPGSIEHGNGGYNIVKKSLARVTNNFTNDKWDATTKTYKGTQKELISAIYDQRLTRTAENSNKLFYWRGNTDISRHAAIIKRLENEKADALKVDQVASQTIYRSWEDPNPV